MRRDAQRLQDILDAISATLAICKSWQTGV